MFEMLKIKMKKNRDKRNEKYNIKLRSIIKNSSPSVICNNCVGGVIYHNLGLRFFSPTINLFFHHKDFILYLKYFDEFCKAELENAGSEECGYPVGRLTIPKAQIKIYFQHYVSFKQAKEKWEERTKRIDKENMFVIFEEGKECTEYVLKEFEALPYKNKIVLSNKEKTWLENSFAFDIYGRGYHAGKLLDFGPTNYGSKRYLDRFDYVRFLKNGSIATDCNLKLEHLISVIGRKDFDFIKDLCITCDAVIVNQMSDNIESEKEYEGKKIRIYNSAEKGLSKSRNMLLDNAGGDICILTDDDLKYEANYDRYIKNAYKRNPDYDIIIFHFSESDMFDTRPKFKSETEVNIFNCSKISSAEITFKIESIRKAGLRFDEIIGIGTRFAGGEENAFIADALRAGLKIKAVPVTICSTFLAHDIEKEEKTAENIHETLIYKGAAFYRIYGRSWLLFGMAFVFLKKQRVFGNISYITACRWLCEGKNEYIKERRNSNVF